MVYHPLFCVVRPGGSPTGATKTRGRDASRTPGWPARRLKAQEWFGSRSAPTLRAAGDQADVRDRVQFCVVLRVSALTVREVPEAHPGQVAASAQAPPPAGRRGTAPVEIFAR